MSRFSLAGLLRVRTVQEEQARRDLGHAQVRLASDATAVERRVAALATAGNVPDGTAPVFLAGVAARSSMAAAVNEAVALRAQSAVELEAARSQWLQARMRHRAVERLAERDRQIQWAERVKQEQILADDLTSARYTALRRATPATSPDPTTQEPQG